MTNPIILFDGVCSLCNSSVNFIIKYDKKRIFRYTPIQSIKSKSIFANLSPEHSSNDSVMLLQNGKLFTKSTAALLIAANLTFPLNLLVIFKLVPKFLLDKIYDFVAANRYNWFGRKESCMIPSEEIKNLFIE